MRNNPGVVIPDEDDAVPPTNFCLACADCQYAAVCKKLKDKREEWEETRRLTRRN